MSELRQDPTTLDWVIIAKNRSKRPDEFKKNELKKIAINAYEETCPFCIGNEDKTPKAEAVYGDTNGKWNIRVVANKFSALTPDGNTKREEWKLFRKIHGYGRHEVIIETPLHNEFIPFMSDDHLKDFIIALRDRYHYLKKDPNIKIIIIFKNHGENAGTSLGHPHSQIVASPVVPPYIRRKFEVATQYFDNTGRSLHFDLQKAEIEDGTRIIDNNLNFVALHPFASHFPFETWIMPKIHKSSFGSISDNEINDLTGVLKGILLKLYKSLNDPDYNLIIHTAPVDDERKEYYLWHIEIIPRLTQVAGFELGSRITVNTALPEETAAFIRNFKI
ncbi:MAG: galactose-1-phosphate uridylyltransferase [bacterium]|nr:galactose-1-phosphate uridylyltransferase [bacterium]